MLIDQRNWAEQGPILRDQIAAADIIGFDVETHDADRHEGLNRRCKYREDGSKPSNSKLIFDFRRTTLCGASFYTENMPHKGVYLNFGHADWQNALKPSDLRWLLDARKDGAMWVAHNAPFEIAVLKSCLDYDLPPHILCTMQMCVSAFGPDQYDKGVFGRADLGGIKSLLPILERLSTQFDPETSKLGRELEEFVFKILSKSSDAAHSYNGYIKEMAYGYGLKDVVKSFFGVQMATFKETLGDEIHMGKLTGEDVAAYGADDAYWAVSLFRYLISFMLQNGGVPVLKAFNETENPMTHVYADLRLGGLRVNTPAIVDQKANEQQKAGETLRTMRAAVRQLLPFSAEPNLKLLAHEKWYANNFAKYRKAIAAWAEQADHPDAKVELSRVNGSVSKSFGFEKGLGPNFSHYMPIRVLLYDLIGAKLLVTHGKLQSDGEARGKLREGLTGPAATVVDCLNAMSGIDQRMKLYLQPYLDLTDPETGRLYPTVTSMLATRRMAASEPNSMQLAKRGDSTYVRGFFEADHDDHVMVSLDWSAIELVEIGEFSGDPEFISAFGQLPHDDLHSGAAADILSVEVPGLNTEMFKSLRTTVDWSGFPDLENLDRLKHNLKSEPLTPAGAYKYWRTEVGKGANFNYWYSGFLSTIAERMGWGPDKASAATDRYKERFWVAEQWRLDLIAEVARNGFITMPDGHRYTRYEATEAWHNEFCSKFIHNPPDPLMKEFYALVRWMANKIRRRGGNQTVNAYIQGSCATIAKRSILRINQRFKDMGWTPREARFLMPVHDELVFSIHRDLTAPAIRLIYDVMTDHPSLFTKCKLDSSPSVGLTFEPWNSKKSPLGQIELFELPKEIFGEAREGKRATDDEINHAVDWLYSQRVRLAA